MLTLAYQPDELECDLAPDDESDADLVTEILIALLSDARVDPSELPEGVANRGFWADELEEDEGQLGSRLWLLEHAPASDETTRLAEAYARDALAYLVRDKRAKSVDASAELIGELVELVVRIDDVERARVRVNG